MDYKAVLEEQVRDLQKVQSTIPCEGYHDILCNKIAVAEEIRKIIETIQDLSK